MSECRLCSCKLDLINLFNPSLKNSRELRCFIIQATGIEIKETDIVSKYVCRRCCILAIKIYSYRTKAVTNDKFLKEKCGQRDSPTPTVPSSTVKDTNETKFRAKTDSPTPSCSSQKPFDVALPIFIKKHPSVEKIIDKYPELIIPPKIFKSHIDPIITLEKTDISAFLQKIDKQDKILHTDEKQPNDFDVNDKICNENSGINVVSAIKKPEIVTSTPVKHIACQSKSKNVAKKKTTVVKSTKKKRKFLIDSDDSDFDLEFMPIPKKRFFLEMPDKEKTSEELKVATNEKEAFTNSLGLAPKMQESISNEISKEEPNINSSPGKNLMLSSVKEIRTFVCYICNRVCYTRRKLMEHQRTHLQCKICKIKLQNITSLVDHLNETCCSKTLPNLVLTRVDEDPEIISKYKDILLVHNPLKLHEFIPEVFEKTSEIHKIEDVNKAIVTKTDVINDSSRIQENGKDVIKISETPNSNYLKISEKPSNSQYLKISETPSNSQYLKITKTSDSQHLQISEKPSNSQCLRISETPSNSQNLKITETPDSQYIKISKKTSNSQCLRISETSTNSQNLKITKTLDQCRSETPNKISEKPSNSQCLRISETSTNSQNLKITKTPDQCRSETPDKISEKPSNSQCHSDTPSTAQNLNSETLHLQNPRLLKFLEKSVTTSKESLSYNLVTKKLATTPKSRKKTNSILSTDNVVCISDSEEEDTKNDKASLLDNNVVHTKEDLDKNPAVPMESVSIIRPEIFCSENLNIRPVLPGKSFENEDFVIKQLFKKYSVNKNLSRDTQSFLPSESSIKVVGKNIMCVENMFLDLEMYKIPVELVCGGNIKLDFTKPNHEKSTKANFNWQKFVVNNIIFKNTSNFANRQQATTTVGESSGQINQVDVTCPSQAQIVYLNCNNQSTSNVQPAILLNGNTGFLTNKQSLNVSAPVSLSVVPNSKNLHYQSSKNITPPRVESGKRNTQQFIVISQNQVNSASPNTTILNNHSNLNKKILIPTVVPDQSRVSVPSNISLSKADMPSLNHTNSNQKNKLFILPKTNETKTQNTISTFSNSAASSNHAPVNSNCIPATNNKISTQNNSTLVGNLNNDSVSLNVGNSSAGSANNNQLQSGIQPPVKTVQLRVKNLWELTGRK